MRSVSSKLVRIGGLPSMFDLPTGPFSTSLTNGERICDRWAQIL